MSFDILGRLNLFRPFVALATPAHVWPSLREALNTHLLALDAVLNALDGGNVEFARIPQDHARPALTFAVLSDPREFTLAGPLSTRTARVRFTASGPDPVANVAVIDALAVELEKPTLRKLGGHLPVLFCLPDAPDTGNDEEPADPQDGSDAALFGASVVYRIRYRTRPPAG